MLEILEAQETKEDTTKTTKAGKSNDDDDEEASSDDEEDDKETFIPCSHEVSMVHGSKAVTAMSCDPSGARLASGIKFNSHLQ